MAGDEDNGNFHPGLSRSPLQIKPAKSRLPHIEHLAAGHVRALAPQEQCMPRRELLSPAQREALLALPTDEGELIRHYTLGADDFYLIRQQQPARIRRTAMLFAFPGSINRR
jgi:Domain of unknown function (DUF4158)